MHTHELILEKDIQLGNMTLLNKNYLGSKAKQKKQMQAKLTPPSTCLIAGHKLTEEPLPH